MGVLSEELDFEVELGLLEASCFDFEGVELILYETRSITEGRSPEQGLI